MRYANVLLVTMLCTAGLSYGMQPTSNNNQNNAGIWAHIRSGAGYVGQYANAVKQYIAEHPNESAVTAVGAVSLGVLAEGAYKAYKDEFSNGASTWQKVRYGLALAGICGCGYFAAHKYGVAPHHGAQALYGRLSG